MSILDSYDLIYLGFERQEVYRTCIIANSNLTFPNGEKFPSLKVEVIQDIREEFELGHPIIEFLHLEVEERLDVGSRCFLVSNDVVSGLP